MKGNVWKFGDDIDTDVILPGRYLILTDEKELAKHVMEGEDPDFSSKISEGDFIVGGKNFGCGSSREHAPIALKGAGIKAVIAESFARIFYRNSINKGLLVLESKEASKNIEEGEEIAVDIDKGIITSAKGEYEFKPLPKFIKKILKNDGLIKYLKNNDINKDIEK